MSRILVVAGNARSVQSIGQILTAENHQVGVLADAAQALKVAEDHPPQLVLVDGELKDAEKLLRAFARRQGGPGAVVMLGRANVPETKTVESLADGILALPLDEEDLLEAVEEYAAPSEKAPQQAKPKKKAAISKADLFGDVVEAVEQEISKEQKPVAKKAAPVSSAELFGDVVEAIESEVAKEAEPKKAATKPSVKSSLKPAAKKTKQVRKKGASATQASLSKQLDETLAGLVRPTKRPAKKKTPPPKKAVKSAPRAKAVPPEKPEPTEPPDPNQFGPYLLEERIGAGGMAEVWKARRQGLEGFQKTVAIKRILPHLSADADFVEMFIDEAKLAAQLNHANIIHIYDLGKIDESYYIAMEHVEGNNLRAVLKEARSRGEAIPVGISLWIAHALTEALDHAHHKRDFSDQELGLVHRDVSPHNVLLSFEGDIKLCDFGIAKAAFRNSNTQSGALKGKLRYMSPEQARGEQVDARSDIFATGAILYEMLSGRPLFSGDSELSLLEVVREAGFEDLKTVDASLPEPVCDLVRGALAKDPRERVPSAGSFASGLEECLKTLNLTVGKSDLAEYMKGLFLGGETADGGETQTTGTEVTHTKETWDLPSLPSAPDPATPTFQVELEEGAQSLDSLEMPSMPVQEEMEGLQLDEPGPEMPALSSDPPEATLGGVEAEAEGLEMPSLGAQLESPVESPVEVEPQFEPPPIPDIPELPSEARAPEVSATSASDESEALRPLELEPLPGGAGDAAGGDRQVSTARSATRSAKRSESAVPTSSGEGLRANLLLLVVVIALAVLAGWLVMTAIRSSREEDPSSQRVPEPSISRRVDLPVHLVRATKAEYSFGARNGYGTRAARLTLGGIDGAVQRSKEVLRQRS